MLHKKTQEVPWSPLCSKALQIIQNYKNKIHSKQKQMKNNSEHFPAATLQKFNQICLKCTLTSVKICQNPQMHSFDHSPQYPYSSTSYSHQASSTTSYQLFQDKNNSNLKYRLYSLKGQLDVFQDVQKNRRTSQKNDGHFHNKNLKTFAEISKEYERRRRNCNVNQVRVIGVYHPDIKAHCDFKVPYPCVLTEHIDPVSSIGSFIADSLMQRIILDWISGLQSLIQNYGDNFQIGSEMLGVHKSGDGSFTGKVWLNGDFSRNEGIVLRRNSPNKSYEKYLINFIGKMVAGKLDHINIMDMNFSGAKNCLRNWNRKSGQQIKHRTINMYSTLKKPTPLLNIDLEVDHQSNSKPKPRTCANSPGNIHKQQKIKVVTPSQHQPNQRNIQQPHHAIVKEVILCKNTHTNSRSVLQNEILPHQNKIKLNENNSRKYLVLSGKKSRQSSAQKNNIKQREVLKLGSHKNKMCSPKSNDSKNSTTVVHHLHGSSEPEGNHRKLEIKDLQYKIVVHDEDKAQKPCWKSPTQDFLSIIAPETQKPKQIIQIKSKRLKQPQQITPKPQPTPHSTRPNSLNLHSTKHIPLNGDTTQINQNLQLKSKLKTGKHTENGDKINPIQKIRAHNHRSLSIEKIPTLFKNFQKAPKQNPFTPNQSPLCQSQVPSEKLVKQDSGRSSQGSPSKKSIEKVDLVRYESYYDRIITQPLPFSQNSIKLEKGQYKEPQPYKPSKFLENITPIKPLPVMQEEISADKRWENKNQAVDLDFDYQKWKQVYSQGQKQISSQEEEEKKNSFSWEISERDEDDSVSIQTFSQAQPAKNYSQLSHEMRQNLMKQKGDIQVIDSYYTIMDPNNASNKKFVFEQSLIVKGMQQDNQKHNNGRDTIRKNLRLNQTLLQKTKKGSQGEEVIQCMSPIYKLNSKQLKKVRSEDQTISDEQDTQFLVLKPIQ